MQYKEKLIEVIIHLIHLQNIWNNDHDSHKIKEVTCIFASVSDGFLVVVVVLRGIMLIIKYQKYQRQNFG